MAVGCWLYVGETAVFWPTTCSVIDVFTVFIIESLVRWL